MQAYLAQDARGPEVRALQQCLNQYGAALREDGDFGPVTAAAVFFAHRALGGEAAVGKPVAWPGLEASLADLRPAPAIMPRTLVRQLVPYLTQRDNYYRPTGTCNLTCVAMVLAAYGRSIVDHGADGKRRQLEDTLYEHLHAPGTAAALRRSGVDAGLLANYPPEQLHKALEYLLRERGEEETAGSAFSTATPRQAILDHVLLRQRPALLTGKFTPSGHVVLAVGGTAWGDLLIHDPWGDWLTGYSSAQGAFRLYPAARLWGTAGALRRSAPDYYWATLVGPRA